MQKTIYVDKETQHLLETLKVPVSSLLREVLQQGLVTHHSKARIRRVSPDPASPPTTSTIPDGVAVLDGRTALYNPTIAEMDELGATSVVVEWYDWHKRQWVSN